MRPMIAHIVLSAICRPSLSGVALADRRDQVDVLLHVGVRLVPLEGPRRRPGDLRRAAELIATPLLPTIRSSTRSWQPLVWRHMLLTRTPFGILELDREVVVDVAVLPAPTRTWRPPMPMTFFGIVPDRPVRHVDVVNVLFDDVIAGEPGEVEPVAALPLHLRHLRRALLHPEVALVPVAPARRRSRQSARPGSASSSPGSGAGAGAECRRRRRASSAWRAPTRR